VDVINMAPGRTTLIKLVPEGQVVTQGQVIAELDSSGLGDQLIHQEIAAKQAEAESESAHKTREVAEIAQKEYSEGIAPQEEKTAKGALELARTELAVAKDRAAKAKEGSIARRDAEVRVLRAQNAVAAAERALDIFVKFTRPKREVELRADVQRAIADERGKKATFELEQAKAVKLRAQVEQCTIHAPADGRLIYANEVVRDGRRFRLPLIEEGAMVRERQVLFRIAEAGVGRDEPKK
jgi:multidrug resistance efflux pump